MATPRTNYRFSPLELECEQTLKSMGYSDREARKGAYKGYGDVSRAIEYLLSAQSAPAAKSGPSVTSSSNKSLNSLSSQTNHDRVNVHGTGISQPNSSTVSNSSHPSSAPSDHLSYSSLHPQQPSIQRSLSSPNRMMEEKDKKKERKQLAPPQFHAALSQKLSQISVGDFVDLRDEVGFWLEGEILDKSKTHWKVRYIQWGPKYDEVWDITNPVTQARIADFHRYSAPLPQDLGVMEVGHEVRVWRLYLDPAEAARRGQTGWIRGSVREVKEGHVQIGTKPCNWYHVRGPDIASLTAPGTVMVQLTQGMYVEAWHTGEECFHSAKLSSRLGDVVTVGFEDGLQLKIDLADPEQAKLVRMIGSGLPDSERELIKQREMEKMVTQLAKQVNRWIYIYILIHFI